MAVTVRGDRLLPRKVRAGSHGVIETLRDSHRNGSHRRQSLHEHRREELAGKHLVELQPRQRFLVESVVEHLGIDRVRSHELDRLTLERSRRAHRQAVGAARCPGR